MSNGEVLVTNYGGGSVVIVGSDGQVSDPVAGNFVGAIAATQLNDGSIVVAEYGGHKLWHLSDASVRGTIAGLTAEVAVRCTNLTSTAAVDILLASPAARAYDCTAAGLEIAEGDVVEVNIIASPASTASTPPTIAYISVPPLGSDALLLGRANVTTPSDYKTATYIRVFGMYYTKPSYATPTIPLESDGSFTVDISTGSNDTSSDRIITFLVPSDYSVPLVSGQPALPLELDAMAIGKAEITR